MTLRHFFYAFVAVCFSSIASATPFTITVSSAFSPNPVSVGGTTVATYQVKNNLGIDINGEMVYTLPSTAMIASGCTSIAASQTCTLTLSYQPQMVETVNSGPIVKVVHNG